MSARNLLPLKQRTSLTSGTPHPTDSFNCADGEDGGFVRTPELCAKIVLAVNHHDALVAALEVLVGYQDGAGRDAREYGDPESEVEADFSPESEVEADFGTARALLAKAREAAQ